MDKGTFFFAMKCGSCHPGDQALKYDRNGYPYWNGTSFGYVQAIADGKYTGPIVRSGTAPNFTYANVPLDGDYGWIVPANRLNGPTGPYPNANVNLDKPAPWNSAGLVEADCLLCHGGARMDAYGNNFSWMDRSASLGAQKFGLAPNATMGWTDVVQCQRGDTSCDPFPQSSYALNMMPMNFPPTMKNIDVATGKYNPNVAYTNPDGSLKAGLVEVNDGLGNMVLAFADGTINKTPTDANCQGCHAFPDIKKSGKIWQPGAHLDAHVGRLGCVDCHPSQDGIGHNFAKGDTGPTGTVRDDLDFVGMKTCANCHLQGGSVTAPSPTTPRAGSVALANHTTIPAIHFTRIACQGCHIPYARWGYHPTLTFLGITGNPPMPMITDAVYDMATNGTQLMYPWAAFMGDDPLSAGTHLYQMGMTPAQYEAAGGTYKWYPAIVDYKGKLTTGKPAVTAYFGDWNGLSGDLAIVQPYATRLVRKALTGGYGAYANRPGYVGNPSLDPNPFSPAEIQSALVALKSATDVDTGSTFVTNPALVKAGWIYYLDAAGALQKFPSLEAESHSFFVGHEVAPLKSTDPMYSSGPLGTGGCADCHAPSSPFFYGQKLVDFRGESGVPAYAEQYQLMGYSDAQVAQLAGAALTVRQVDATGTVVSAETGKWYSTDGTQAWVDTAISCGAACQADFSPPAFQRRTTRTVNLTATPPAGFRVKSWTGCATATGNACAVAMDQTKIVYVQYEPDVLTLTAIPTGTGAGAIGSNPAGTPSCVAGTATCRTLAYPSGTASVVLTATPAQGSSFNRWMGCPSASGTTCTLAASDLASGPIVYAVFDAL